MDTCRSGCLICTWFIFLYLHLFSAVEHVSHGKALSKYSCQNNNNNHHHHHHRHRHHHRRRRRRRSVFIIIIIIIVIIISALLLQAPGRVTTKATCLKRLIRLHRWKRGCCGVLTAEGPSNMLTYLRDGVARTRARAATLRQKLQIELSISPSRSILTPGQRVPALTL